MYLEQALKGKNKIWAYLIYIGCFIGFIGINIFFSMDMDNESAIRIMIDQFGKSIAFIMLLVPFVFLLVTLFLWYYFVHGKPLISLTTSRKSVDWKRVFLSFFLWGILTTILIVIDYNMSPENYQFNFELKRFIVLLVIAIILVPIQTSFEEYFFRGYFMQAIGVVAKNKWVPLIVTSVIFGLMHIANPEVSKLGGVIMIYYIGTGLFLGIMTLMDEGLELALGFHAANNLFTALLVTSTWTAFQTDSILISIAPIQSNWLEIVIPVFIIFPLLLFIFSKVYKWDNWRDRLFGKINDSSNNEIDIIRNNEDTPSVQD